MSWLYLVLFIAFVVGLTLWMERRAEKRCMSVQADEAVRGLTTIARKRAHSRNIPLPIMEDEATPVLVPKPTRTAGEIAVRNGSAPRPVTPLGQYAQHRRRG